MIRALGRFLFKTTGAAAMARRWRARSAARSKGDPFDRGHPKIAHRGADAAMSFPTARVSKPTEFFVTPIRPICLHEDERVLLMHPLALPCFAEFDGERIVLVELKPHA